MWACQRWPVGAVLARDRAAAVAAAEDCECDWNCCEAEWEGGGDW